MHTHILPSVFEEDSVKRFTGRTDPKDSWRFLPAALDYMKQAGIAKLNILGWMGTGFLFLQAIRDLPPTPEGREKAHEAARSIIQKVIAFNEWGIKAHRDHSNVSYFICPEPRLMDEKALLAEMEDKFRRGASGLKLIPNDYHMFFNDRRYWPIYDYCQSQNVPIVSYAGGAYGFYTAETEQWAHPRYLTEVLKAFPRLKVNYAHMCGGGEDVFTDQVKWHKGLHGDLSSRLNRVVNKEETPAELVALIRKVGVERTMFGTNFGLQTLEQAKAQQKAFLELPLTDGEKEKIGYQNFDIFTKRQTP